MDLLQYLLWLLGLTTDPPPATPDDTGDDDRGKSPIGG
jgi:hypothetical protein